MVEADADEEGGLAEPRELAGLDLDGVRVVEGGGEALHADAVAPHRLDERLEVGGGGDDGDGAAAPRGGGGEQQDERRAPARRGTGYFLAVKMALGTMQCTPLRTSTTWVTRQSPTIEVSEYAS